MGQTYAYYAAALKEFYGTAIQETFNYEVLLKRYLEESSKKWDGLRVNFPAHTARNLSVAARAEAATLPTAGQQSAVSVYVTPAYLYGRIDLTGQVMAAAGKNAFAEALSYEMEKVKDDFSKDVGRQVYGEGLGILAQVSPGTSSTSSQIALDNQFKKPGQPGARFMEVGMILQIGNTSCSDVATTGSPVLVCATTIQANSGTTYDLLTHSSCLDLGGDGSLTYVFSYGIYGKADPKGLELKGLRAIVDDITQTNLYGLTAGYNGNSALFNVDRGVVKGWNSVVDQNSGTERVLDSYLLQRTMSKIKKASGKDPDIMFGEYETVDAFWDSVAGDRRFASKNFDAGVDTLTFNGKTMVKDLLAPYNELYMLHKPALKWYVLKELGFADDDGNVMKNVTGYDRFEAFLRMYAQLGAGEEAAPNSCGVIRDIKTRL